MKFFEGDVKNAILRRKTFCSAFMVFVESNDLESASFRKLLEEENSIPVKEYVAFRISPSSDSFKYFRTIYSEIPVPSLIIIGNNGHLIRILTSCYPKEDFYAKIKEAVETHKVESMTARRSNRLQNDNFVQILLKLPKGETAVVEFLESSDLREVRAFVKESLQMKAPFQMINPYPRKIFSLEEESQTLSDLRLSPTSTILVVPLDKKQIWKPKFFSTFATLLLVTVGRVVKSIKKWFCNLLPGSQR